MEWRKMMAKRTIEWARDDIKFNASCEAEWKTMLKRHLDRKHEGKYDPSCETCRLWKEIIEGAREETIKAKKKIQEVLRGEG